MSNRTIPVAEAEAMIQAYTDYMSSLGVNDQTQSVSFSTAPLLKWMTDVSPFADEFRIFLGVYPPGSASAGRITTIIWPYSGGQPAAKSGGEDRDGGSDLLKPFNEGGLQP